MVSSALKPATREIREDTEVVRLGMHQDGYERFTTKELYKREQEIIESVDRGKDSKEHCVTDRSLLKAIPTKRPVKTEQIAAATHVTQGKGSVLCVSGRAGTGKTTMVGIARRAWEKEGYTVLGCALSGKAAGELSEGAKVKSVTIAKLIYDLDNPGRKDRLTLDSKTVLVVDEAGMVGTRALHRLVMETERAGARLVLVGDERQLQSIDSGGGFAGLANRLGYAELKEITRQQDPEDRQAVYDLSNGNPGPALRSYASRGRLILGKDQADAMQHLVEDWGKDTAPLKDRLILSSTNVQAFALNQFCQDVRQKRGELGEASVTVRDGVTVHVGDRVLFTRNDRRMGVHNGDLATVVRVTAGDEENNPEQAATVRVKLDNGRIRTVSLAKYDPNDITLGYSVTTHKSQGATVNNAYVLLYGAMTDAQMAYVQASRARMVTRLYTTDDEAGPELSDLTKSMSRDRRKTMAHDVIAAGETLGQSSGRGLRHELRPEF